LKKTGLLGGTFNPVHSGHLIMANELLIKLKLDNIVFMPNNIPSHKKNLNSVAPGDMRLKMIKFAIEGNEKFEISDLELKSNEVSYTYNTLIKLKKNIRKDKLFFITGSDSIMFSRWFNLDGVLGLVDGFISVLRPGTSEKDFYKAVERLKLKNVSKIKLLEVPVLDISSSEIRRRINKKIPIKYLVPEKVENYIKKNNIYSGGDHH